MFTLQKSKPRSSREQIRLKGVSEDVLILPENKYRAILEINPINFELKSEVEQDHIVDNYQAFLNALPCSIQILFRVREIDLDKYLDSFVENINPKQASTHKVQLKNYDRFVRRLVKDNKILSRNFYLVIPQDTQEKVDVAIAAQQLKLLEEIIHKGLERLGIQTRRLSGIELLDLFYSFYNPEQSKYQSITSQTLKLMESSHL